MSPVFHSEVQHVPFVRGYIADMSNGMRALRGGPQWGDLRRSVADHLRLLAREPFGAFNLHPYANLPAR